MNRYFKRAAAMALILTAPACTPDPVAQEPTYEELGNQIETIMKESVLQSKPVPASFANLFAAQYRLGMLQDDPLLEKTEEGRCLLAKIPAFEGDFAAKFINASVAIDSSQQSKEARDQAHLQLSVQSDEIEKTGQQNIMIQCAKISAGLKP